MTDGPKGTVWHATVAALGSRKVPNAKALVRKRKRGKVSYVNV